MQDKTWQERVNMEYELQFDNDMKELIDKATGKLEGENELADHILEMKLITTHHDSDTKEWSIVLGTGGPAYRVLATVDEKGEVIDADFQFQDWFQPWTSATNQDKELMIDFAQACGISLEV